MKTLFQKLTANKIRFILLVILLLILATGAILALISSYINKNLLYGSNICDAEEKILVTGDKVTYHRNICYGTTYPNSYMDIAYNTIGNENAPTIVFIHGGAFIGYTNMLYTFGAWGEEIDEPYKFYLDQGYNIVSMDYAYAPDYTYPTPVIQCQECMSYLGEHSKKLGLNLDKCILMGSSAGGHIAGVYSACLTNPEYALQNGISFTGMEPEIDALILECALIDPARFDKTNSWKVNLIFHKPMTEYFSADALSLGNFMNYITDDFPATLIEDGSECSFSDQAYDLAEMLNQADIPYTCQVYQGMSHAFDYMDCSEADEARNCVLSFITSH